MAEILAKIDNQIERDIYVNQFARELGVGKEAILAEIEKKTLRNIAKNKSVPIHSKDILQVNQMGYQATKTNEDILIYLENFVARIVQIFQLSRNRQIFRYELLIQSRDLTVQLRNVSRRLSR